MPFTEYVTTTQVLEVLDEQIVAKLANRSNAKSWDKATIERAKKLASGIFESYAVNQYGLVDLRVDPPPEFAVLHNLNLVVYFVYSKNKRHQVPEAVKEDYDETMEILRAWGEPKLIDASGVIVVASEVGMTVTYESEELEFPYYTVASKMF